jgi:hypothetical protein
VREMFEKMSARCQGLKERCLKDYGMEGWRLVYICMPGLFSPPSSPWATPCRGGGASRCTTREGLVYRYIRYCSLLYGPQIYVPVI